MLLYKPINKYPEKSTRQSTADIMLSPPGSLGKNSAVKSQKRLTEDQNIISHAI
jgi:hypothetical protein